MTEDKKIYVISVYSENQIGLLGSISNIFARRNINIESLTVFPSEFPGVQGNCRRAHCGHACEAYRKEG